MKLLDWSRKFMRRPGAAPPGAEPEEPIRSELFSVERLEGHAESLATAVQYCCAHSHIWL